MPTARCEGPSAKKVLAKQIHACKTRGLVCEGISNVEAGTGVCTSAFATHTACGLRFLPLGLAALVSSYTFGATQAAPPSVSNMLTVHIEVTSGLNSSLAVKNFDVLQGAARFAPVLTHPSDLTAPARPGVPTHVLLMLSTSVAQMPASTREKLLEMAARGWWVSVTEPGGNITPYVNARSSLESALDALPDQAGLQQQSKAPVPSRSATPHVDAVNQLSAFTGRRVLIVMAGGVGQPFLTYSRGLIPEVYFAVGSAHLRNEQKAAQNETARKEMLGLDENGQPIVGDLCQGFGCNQSDPNMRDFFPMPAPGQKVGPKSVYYGLTIPERAHPVQLATVGDALERTVVAARWYYDLSFTVPAADLDKPFTLRFRHMPSRRIQGAASIYTVGVGATTPSIRKPVSGGLDLKF